MGCLPSFLPGIWIALRVVHWRQSHWNLAQTFHLAHRLQDLAFRVPGPASLQSGWGNDFLGREKWQSVANIIPILVPPSPTSPPPIQCWRYGSDFGIVLEGSRTVFSQLKWITRGFLCDVKMREKKSFVVEEGRASVGLLKQYAEILSWSPKSAFIISQRAAGWLAGWPHGTKTTNVTCSKFI